MHRRDTIFDIDWEITLIWLRWSVQDWAFNSLAQLNLDLDYFSFSFNYILLLNMVKTLTMNYGLNVYIAIFQDIKYYRFSLSIQTGLIYSSFFTGRKLASCWRGVAECIHVHVHDEGVQDIYSLKRSESPMNLFIHENYVYHS